MKKDKNRNVDAESHLLTGGLITGFLTFMGFLPGAATSAVVTAISVANDINEEEKRKIARQTEEEKIKYEQKKNGDWFGFYLKTLSPLFDQIIGGSITANFIKKQKKLNEMYKDVPVLKIERFYDYGVIFKRNDKSELERVPRIDFDYQEELDFDVMIPYKLQANEHRYTYYLCKIKGKTYAGRVPIYDDFVEKCEQYGIDYTNAFNNKKEELEIKKWFYELYDKGVRDFERQIRT